MDLSDFSLQKLRASYREPVPAVFSKSGNLIPTPSKTTSLLPSELAHIFPNTANKPYLSFKSGPAGPKKALRVAALFSGGQAPGGHNVLSGLFDYLAKSHPGSFLIGFIGGPSGLISNSYIEITATLIDQYRNQGGFDLLGSGRTKIETPEQFSAAERSVNDNNLDGLIIIGGDDSNTNAALLAEYFVTRDVHTNVVGVPKTIDGDLKNEQIECSFGFDTASKVYSELIANIQRDALSAKKYCHFIKLMGRTASHITLECALRTHPNAALIGEEIAEDQSSLNDIVQKLASIISDRSAKGKDYGVFLIPEGILEFIPECKILFKELSKIAINDNDQAKTDQHVDSDKILEALQKQLSNASKRCLQLLPKDIQLQLLQDRDPHGNIQVSQIESERLFISMLKIELNKRKAEGSYTGKFSPLPHFYGYEGRACYPSNFDAQYCYALGLTAGALIQAEANGYLACVNKLSLPVQNWEINGVPLNSLMHIEERSGKSKPVIAKALVDLKGKPFKSFCENRDRWAIDDKYEYPGPIQYFGPHELTDAITITLQLESEAKNSSATKQLTTSPRD